MGKQQDSRLLFLSIFYDLFHTDVAKSRGLHGFMGLPLPMGVSVWVQN